MERPPLCFDAVIFDLDGTLVATDRFWVDAARAGARRAFAELGIERAMPSAADWMGLVGLPLARGFELLFPELDPGSRALVMKYCVEEEHRALRAGQAALLPGVAEALGELCERGLKLGLASNCGRDYLAAMLDDLGLARWIHEARCLDTPGVRTKGGMVKDLLASFGTRSAVMVGDRQGDRDAAWQNGIPHVHCARGFAAQGEDLAAEAVIEDMSALVPRLERRAQWIQDALEGLGFLREWPPRTLGITGHSGSGKTLFARDVVRVLARGQRRAVVVALDDFLKSGDSRADLTNTAFWPAERPLDHLEHGFELDSLIDGVIAPHARGEDVHHEHGKIVIDVHASDVLVLQGLFLLHPRLRSVLERVIHLDVSENLSLRRVAGRDAEAGPDALLRVRRHFLPTQRAFDELIPPARADLVLAADNALGPE